MRPVYAITVVAACALYAHAAALPGAANLTVVLDFKGAAATRTIFEMQREAAGIVSASGIRLDWRDRAAAEHALFADLVVFTFKGNCVVDPEPAPPVYDELGPLAVTRTANGSIQPFGEVDCARVSAAVRSAMWGRDLARSDELMGRALGRVVAHELVHMLTRSGEHSRLGVQERALSGKQLISDSLPLSGADIDRIRQRIEH